jgi:gluconate 2-dehydrogenase subunit 3-like protein
MPVPNVTRRDFLAGLGRASVAGGMALHLSWLAACAREEHPFARLTDAEARTMEAFAAQILPSDDGTPGAGEAGAVRFIDHALGMPFFADAVPHVHAGLADLDARARRMGARDGFAALPHARQIAVMRQVERDPFFAVARAMVIMGTLADPSYGGNRDGMGWSMIGMEHRPAFVPPFGWYDAGARGT